MSHKELLLGCLFAIACGGVANADEPAVRTWSDASGSFKVQATLVNQTSGTVSLKKADGKVITVPRTLLSDSDQAFLQELAGNAPEPGAVEVLMDLSSDDLQPLPEPNHVLLGGPMAITQLAPDRPASYLTYKPLQALATDVDAYDKISPPIVLDRDAGVFAVSIGRHVAGEPESQRGRLGRARYGSSKTELLVDVKESVDILDHHIESGNTLAIAGKNQLYRGGELVLLRGLMTSPSVVLRRTLPGIDTPGFKPDVEWSAMLGPTTAALKINDSLYVVELADNTCKYSFEKLQAGSKLAISPGGRYLAISSGGKAVIVETGGGETLGTINIDSLLTPVVMFDPSGSKLLFGYGNQLSIWSLPEAKFVTEITTLKPLGDILGWVHGNLVLTSLAGLIDTDVENPVWEYSLGASTHSVPVVNGILMTDGSDQQLVFRTLPIPHPAVAKIQKRLGRPGTMLIEPGTPVAIKVEAIEGVDEQEVHDAVAETIERLGWKLDASAKIQLVAAIGRGKTESHTFTMQSMRGGTGSTTETVNITPFTAKFEIRSGNEVLWERATRNFVPPSVYLFDGKTLQEAISAYEKPNPEFFSGISLPAKILKPSILKTIGRSTIDNGKWTE